ncbi:uncharacterized protein [Anabrus simplex]|uniref:uncharacterized protein n=1 Tax=Anabrus simplex TaxID=316456 RepID=UPI0035A2857D
MVCKEDVVTWFKELTSHKRIDVMCSLLNMCLPFELRFLGTCLEDLGKRDFHELREAENRANNASELADLQCISDKRTQRKIALYLALLHSCNHACSNGLYKILANCDFGEINTLTNNSSEENPLDELLVLYTLAINHPAFSYEQKLVFGNILMKLQEEESRVYASRHHPVGMGLVYVKPPLQSCVPSPSSEDRGPQDAGVLGHCTGMSIPPTHSAGTDLKARTSIPPGLSLPTGLSIPPDQQLGPATGYVQVTFPAGAPQPIPGVPWASSVGPLMMTSLCDVSGAGEISPYPSSPLMSRQSSPSQSGSPSRAGSPVRVTERSQQNFKGPPPTSRRGDRNPTSAVHRQQNCADTANIVPPSSQHSQRAVPRKSSAEPPDSLRETLGKEMPNYQQNLQNYSADELRRMCDEELKELGLPLGAIHQLRSIVTKLNTTNGLSTLDKREVVPVTSRRKQEPAENEVIAERKTQSAGPVVRRYTGIPMEGAPVMYPPPPPLLAAPPTGPCYTCIAVPVSASAARYQQQHGQAQQIYCMNHSMRSLRLDGSHSSSASDSSSTSHSPPDTPSMPTTLHWDRVYTGKEASTGERWSPGCDDRLDKERRIPESGEKPSGVDEGNGASQQQQQTIHSNNNNNNSNNNNNRPRLPGGLGRSKSNPPGLQTLPRGRGPNPTTVILEGNHKSLPSCRRDGPAVNGAQPPPTRTSHPPTPPHEDRKMFLVPTEMVHYSAVNSTTQPPPPQYTGGNGSGSNPQQQPRPGESNVPYSATTAFLPHGHFPALRSSSSIFPTFAPSSYMRPTFPFPHNGELVYQYQCPQTPPPPPPTAFIHTPVVTYSTVVPPPKLSCYNCGSQSHHATDCKEPTMEEMTKPGQYRIDYSPYQKPGECSSEK